MKGNCGECNRRWACDIDPDKCDMWPDPAPMTNADRIRDMSDEELAEAISSIPMCVGTDDDKDCENDGCKGCFLKWLQQPAEEDDHETM